ncbi:hypothetical protein DAEQUDRAFT_763260 [Daedalea quercina L-15889]|uniref:DUF6533 domain-containing protein n=1 Tax=Daedalea quercina L-15889 TaxID=1314783 RepID=A0A165SKU8_9APHY|nr:hypothetical protein DAEQUDRAFT_763260 [Daedalea quercina L-15889]
MDVSALNDAFATRYLQAIGLTVLFYDHVLTFADEVRLVWFAPCSLAKYAFLFNRYLVLGTLITVACGACFILTLDATLVAKQWLSSMKPFLLGVLTGSSRVSMIAVISIGIANMLVLLRVVILWDERPAVLKLMVVAYAVSLVAQVTTIILTLLHILPGVTWSSVAGMCITSQSSHVIVAVWASPMLFELFVLISTALNAIDRPTSAQTPLVRALCSDGILYFISVSTLRALNVALAGASLSRSSFTLLGVFLVWAMTTTIINRSLLQFRVKQEPIHDDIALMERSTSPKGGSRSNNSSFDISKNLNIEIIEDNVAEVDAMWASRLEKSWHYK